MIIRAYDGSPTDTKSVLAIERATFAECPYAGKQVHAMLRRGPQRAWLAVDEEDGEPAGFCIAFPVCGLAGMWWEIDLLAVHPDWEGQGIGRRLIRAAAAGGNGLTGEARAVVADDNVGSMRAFAAAGFRAADEPCSLLIYRFEGPLTRSRPVPGLTVHRARSLAEAERWLAGTTVAPEVAEGDDPPTLLLSEQNGRPVGYAELVDVQTILYQGTWLQSLVAPGATAREALAMAVLQRADTAQLDEVSAMVPDHNRPLQHTLLAAGFQSMGTYRWFSAALPLEPWTEDS